MGYDNKFQTNLSAIKLFSAGKDLSEAGLVGKVTLSSNMTKDELFGEIRSVFRGPMGGNEDFPFLVLQPTGGTSRSLTIPAVSSTYKWTTGAIISKSTKTPIYILSLTHCRYISYVSKQLT